MTQAHLLSQAFSFPLKPFSEGGQCWEHTANMRQVSQLIGQHQLG